MRIQPCCWTNEEEPPLHSISLVKVCCWAQKETKILTRQKLRSSWGEKSPEKMLFILCSTIRHVSAGRWSWFYPGNPKKHRTLVQPPEITGHVSTAHCHQVRPVPSPSRRPRSACGTNLTLDFTLPWAGDGMLVSSAPTFLCWTLAHSVTVFAARVFGKRAGHESGIPLNGISTLYKIPHRVLCLPPSCEDTATTSMNQEAKPSPDSESASGMPLNLPASITPRNEQLFLSRPAYGTVLQEARLTTTPSTA